MSLRSVRRTVARGAKLLDKREPGWVQTFVKNGKKYGFDMGNPDVCVLGNVFRDAVEAWEDGFNIGAAQLHVYGTSEKYGFDIAGDYTNDSGEDDAKYQQLAEAWQREVLARLRAQKLVGSRWVKHGMLNAYV